MPTLKERIEQKEKLEGAIEGIQSEIVKLREEEEYHQGWLLRFQHQIGELEELNRNQRGLSLSDRKDLTHLKGERAKAKKNIEKCADALEKKKGELVGAQEKLEKLNEKIHSLEDVNREIQEREAEIEAERKKDVRNLESLKQKLADTKAAKKAAEIQRLESQLNAETSATKTSSESPDSTPTGQNQTFQPTTSSSSEAEPGVEIAAEEKAEEKEKLLLEIRALELEAEREEKKPGKVRKFVKQQEQFDSNHQEKSEEELWFEALAKLEARQDERCIKIQSALVELEGKIQRIDKEIAKVRKEKRVSPTPENHANYAELMRNRDDAVFNYRQSEDELDFIVRAEVKKNQHNDRQAPFTLSSSSASDKSVKSAPDSHEAKHEKKKEIEAELRKLDAQIATQEKKARIHAETTATNTSSPVPTPAEQGDTMSPTPSSNAVDNNERVRQLHQHKAQYLNMRGRCQVLMKECEEEMNAIHERWHSNDDDLDSRLEGNDLVRMKQLEENMEIYQKKIDLYGKRMDAIDNKISKLDGSLDKPGVNLTGNDAQCDDETSTCRMSR